LKHKLSEAKDIWKEGDTEGVSNLRGQMNFIEQLGRHWNRRSNSLQRKNEDPEGWLERF
jgi:hypothetical protein